MITTKQYINRFRDFLIQNHAKADFVRMYEGHNLSPLKLSFVSCDPDDFFCATSPTSYIMDAFRWSEDRKNGAPFWARLHNKWRTVVWHNNITFPNY